MRSCPSRTSRGPTPRPDAGTEAARRTGVLDPAAWGEDASDVISEADGRIALERLGEMLQDISVDVRATVHEHDHPLSIVVPANVEDVDATVREHLRRRGLEVDAIHVVRDVKRQEAAGRKKSDKIDALVGSLALRRDREVLLREKATAERGPPNGFLREVVIEDGKTTLMLSDVAIQFWGRSSRTPTLSKVSHFSRKPESGSGSVSSHSKGSELSDGDKDYEWPP